jgi:hypothetical protein
MNRRQILGSIGIGATLTAGCIGGPNDNPTVAIVSDEQVTTDEFRQASNEDINDSAEAIVTEVPDENVVYIYRTLQLPTPSHSASHTVTNNESDSTVRLQYAAESTLEDGQRARSVIQPTPYTVKIQFTHLNSDITINITTIADTQIRYRTTNTQSTTAIKENSQA